MASRCATLLLLALASAVFSSPVPNLPRDIVSSTVSAGAPLPTNPITFGALTAPSLGGVFNDFNTDTPDAQTAEKPKAKTDHHVESRFLRSGKFDNLLKNGRRASLDDILGQEACPPGVQCFKVKPPGARDGNTEA